MLEFVCISGMEKEFDFHSSIYNEQMLLHLLLANISKIYWTCSTIEQTHKFHSVCLGSLYHHYGILQGILYASNNQGYNL